MMDLMTMKEKIQRLLSFRSLPIRNRLVRGSLLIVFLAVATMGIFVFIQTRQINTNLVETFDAAKLKEAENLLTSLVNRHTESLSVYFASLENNLLAIRNYSQGLFRNRSAFETGTYWDAANSLFKNDQGSWDNSNSELGSVFIPAATDLSRAMISNLNVTRHLDLIAPSTLESNTDIIAVYFGGATGYTLYYPNIDLAAIVPADFDVTGRPWYLEAAPDLNPARGAVWSDPYLDAALNGIVITNSAPVYDSKDKFQGVVAQDIQLIKIAESVANIRVGNTGFAFLIDQDRRLIAMPVAGYDTLKIDPQTAPLGDMLTDEILGMPGPEFGRSIQNMAAGDSGLSQITLNDSEYFIAYQPIQGTDFSLAIITPEKELLAEAIAVRGQINRESNNVLGISVFVILGILAATTIVTRNFSNNITNPLISLTKAAEAMAKGNLHARADVVEKNEFGTLASTLNLMASSLKESFNTLESKVLQRTSEVQERSLELESANQQIRRRAAQFEALAQVAQSIASIRDPQELLPRITSVVSEYYGFYHVGIFLVDDFNEFAVLTAANSEGGQRMLARQHRLRIGEEGIVGRVTATGEPRIALDVGSDAVYFGNPDLPDTHSEMALPLRSGGRIIGALDVQSTETGAFTNDDVQTLSLLADQVSLAIENARLFESSNRTLNELQMVMRQTTREAWKRLPEQQKLYGFRYNAMGASPLKDPTDLAEPGKGRTKAGGQRAGFFTVPIELRGEVIGNLVVQSPTRTGWNQDQQDLIRAVAERVALSAENARLFEETTARAERERLVSEITSKIRSHNDPQTMIETAMQELRNALGATRVEIIPKDSAAKDKV